MQKETNTSAPSHRQQEIVSQFFVAIDKNMEAVVAGKALRMLEIGEMADALHIHPTHLSNTIKQVTGKSPCSFYEEKILCVSKKLLAETALPIGEIAARLTYDPSNFTKFFKAYEGMTPKKYREQLPKIDRQ